MPGPEGDLGSDAALVFTNAWSSTESLDRGNFRVCPEAMRKTASLPSMAFNVACMVRPWASVQLRMPAAGAGTGSGARVVSGAGAG